MLQGALGGLNQIYSEIVRWTTLGPVKPVSDTLLLKFAFYRNADRTYLLDLITGRKFSAAHIQ